VRNQAATVARESVTTAVREVGKEPRQQARAEKPAKRKRRFPYRKVAEIETEISEREMRVEELHAALIDPEVLRNGERVRETTAELEEQQERLTLLYEHWEEASELNG
jgi:ATP-binding cassette subfamily F protein 3